MVRPDRPARRRGPYRLRSNHAAAGLDRPADLASAEDGRIFIAERAGRVRVVRDGRPSRRRCPWHDERTGRPGSAFDFAEARKDPGLISGRVFRSSEATLDVEALRPGDRLPRAIHRKQNQGHQHVRGRALVSNCFPRGFTGEDR
jgi:hypothetical protein